MKTTVDIADLLFRQAKKRAAEEGTTLRALVERGLREVLAEKKPRKPARIKLVTFGGKGLTPEFRGAGWDKIRDAIYERDGLPEDEGE
jgi:hypothetical protein